MNTDYFETAGQNLMTALTYPYTWEPQYTCHHIQL